ncbi:MAG: amidohydrolase family protein, partial [Candidatus Korarchaeota archaeon]|nr:amidohydrolase family protein [Candidatus Korarchaeota archaeon]
VITRIRTGVSSCHGCVDRGRYLGIPALVNAHIHLLDSAFPEIGVGLTLREAVAPGAGLKHRMLSSLPRRRLEEAARRTIGYLLSTGTAAIGDFREGGLEGCMLGIGASRGTGMVYVPLCRPSAGLGDLEGVLETAAGLGLPSPLAYSRDELGAIGSRAAEAGKPVHVHVSEDPEDHAAGDLRLALWDLGADVLVHATHLEPGELEEAAGRIRGIVVCPRSNAWWSVGRPPLAGMLELGVTVALGTDNVAWVKPDMWREMEEAFHLLRTQKPGFSDARAVLRAATVNGARLLGLEERGVLEEGYRADLALLEPGVMGLAYSGDPVATIVKRGGPEAVVETYVDGRPVYSLLG